MADTETLRLNECLSCKRNIINDRGSVVFACPQCGKYQIVRCRQCRQIVAKYTCPMCQFEGPN